MILIIAAKQRFVEHFSMTASVKCFLLSMAKVFSFSKLLQQKSEKSLTTLSSLNKLQLNIQ